MIKINKEKLIKDIEKRGANIIVSEWTENAYELSKDIYILNIKKIFNELDESEKDINRVLVHLELIFDRLKDENIDRFLSSQPHIKK
ncbi:hypothetical protein [Malaciobacter mytili]|uniref:Uncharacterized protein n=1 Tax=Malaciobacter mytili LMG 24559 TaxID=1032238 RepID=A0AAX2AEE1_9BACT|nr:hypothetical protein [Malaciobacter mytili]AXH15358.1 hypothetical protein AMYT_1787 [Malaciobacter mytili LMG 24559]RXI43652.1 hypothetical protein CRU99_06890 [Malaciobacter mytili]RXK15362.1 hypothetical protein CP985_08920 [Malaciobacter mytili LMG 24559]